MNEIMVSLIIPAYNVQNYLEIMLESIYNQTYKNFELIIINDGSTDKTEEIIKRYLNLYSNIIYIYQSNLGVSEARNNAIKYIKGKYTLFLDSDDFIEKDMLEKLINKAESEDCDAVICGYTKFYDYDNRSNELFKFNIKENKVYSSLEVLEMILDYQITGYLWNKLFLSQIIFDQNICFEKDRYIEDWLPVVKLIVNSNKICFVNESLYNYRQRATSSLHNKNISLIKDYNYAAKSICEYINELNLKVRKSKYYTFIANVEATQIYSLKNLKIKCSKDIYDQYTIDTISIREIFKNQLPLKIKLKLLLIKLKIIHLFKFN